MNKSMYRKAGQALAKRLNLRNGMEVLLMWMPADKEPYVEIRRARKADDSKGEWCEWWYDSIVEVELEPADFKGSVQVVVEKILKKTKPHLERWYAEQLAELLQ